MRKTALWTVVLVTPAGLGLIAIGANYDAQSDDYGLWTSFWGVCGLLLLGLAGVLLVVLILTWVFGSGDSSKPSEEVRRTEALETLMKNGAELRDRICGYVGGMEESKWAVDDTPESSPWHPWHESPRVKVSMLLRDIRTRVREDFPVYSMRFPIIKETDANIFGNTSRPDVCARLEAELDVLSGVLQELRTHGART